MNKGIKMKFSKNLQHLRQQHNISQEQLAEKLSVSRQAISKWESGDSYPETDKIIAMCELFDCKMDDLVRGEVATKAETSKPANTNHQTQNLPPILAAYDHLMNKFSKNIALGVSIILLGVTTMLAIMSFRELSYHSVAYYDTWGIVALLCSAAISVPLFIINALKLANFKLKHPHIEETYPEEIIEAYNPKFIAGIATGVAIIILGVASMILVQDMDAFAINSTFPPAILMAFITIAVPILVLVSLRRGKFNLTEYNKDRTADHKNEILIGKICGTIMLSATIIFLCLGFIFDLWEICWIVYPIGGICCGIVGTILGPNHR